MTIDFHSLALNESFTVLYLPHKRFKHKLPSLPCLMGFIGLLGFLGCCFVLAVKLLTGINYPASLPFQPVEKVAPAEWLLVDTVLIGGAL